MPEFIATMKCSDASGDVWEQQYRCERCELEQLFSDITKSVQGTRPSMQESSWFARLSTPQKYAELERLKQRVAENDLWELGQQVQAQDEFEQVVRNLLATGASTRTQAIRWLQQAHRAEHDLGVLEYDFGLPFGYLAKGM